MIEKLQDILSALEKLEVRGKMNLNYLLYAIQKVEELLSDEHSTDV